MLIAIVGTAGLQPALAAIRAGKDIAVASKEILVMAGEIVMAEARKHGVKVLAVDSDVGGMGGGVMTMVAGVAFAGDRKAAVGVAGGFGVGEDGEKKAAVDGAAAVVSGLGWVSGPWFSW